MTLHLVRAGARPVAVMPDDWVLYVDPLQLADHGTPPLAPGLIDHDQLVVLVVAARRVITW